MSAALSKFARERLTTELHHVAFGRRAAAGWVPAGTKGHDEVEREARIKLALLNEYDLVLIEDAATWNDASVNAVLGEPVRSTAEGTALGLERAIQHIATTWAEHPDYDETWRPEPTRSHQPA